MEKIKTFTLDWGNGEQNLVDTSMKNILCEIEAMELDGEDDVIECTILIEYKYTQEELEALPDYTG